MRQIDVALPRHNSEYIERDQDAFRMQLLIRTIKEVGDYISALPIRMCRLEMELRVRLVPFSRKTHIVELDLVGSRLCHPLR